MIYYFKAIQSPVDTEERNSLTFYPAEVIYLGKPPPLHFLRRLKRAFWLLTEVVEGNNGKDKNFNYDFFFFFLAMHCFSMTDCMINDIWKSGVEVFLSCKTFFFWSAWSPDVVIVFDTIAVTRSDGRDSNLEKSYLSQCRKCCIISLATFCCHTHLASSPDCVHSCWDLETIIAQDAMD